MKEIVKPTLSNCLQLCQNANRDWQQVILKCKEDIISIIDWRVEYSSLAEFEFAIEHLNNTDIQYFRQIYEQSAVLFYQLLEEEEAKNETERVVISLSQQPNSHLYYSLFTAVAPKNTKLINNNTIDQALKNDKYNAIYIEDSQFQLTRKYKDACCYFIGTDNRIYPINKHAPLYSGVLIIHNDLDKVYSHQLNNKSAQVQIDRIK